MKKSMILLLIFSFLYPVGSMLCSCFGYDFKLCSILVMSIVIMLVAVFTYILSNKCIINIKDKTIKVFSALLAPISLVNMIMYLWADRNIWIFVFHFISVIFCFILSVKLGAPKVLKRIMIIISSVLVAPIILFCLLTILFSGMVQNTVIKTVESPNDKYYACVIDSNQGALGGDTIVDVYKNSGINLIIFKIEKKPQRVYVGEWGEFNDMNIRWLDDNSLVINYSTYKIN